MALQIGTLAKYALVLRQNPDEAQSLADDIFIHVTSFFRDPECLQALRRRVLRNSGSACPFPGRHLGLPCAGHRAAQSALA